MATRKKTASTGKVIVYGKNRKPLKKRTIQKQSDVTRGFIYSAYAVFRLKYMPVLVHLPAFTIEAYTYLKPVLEKSGLSFPIYSDPINLTKYFLYLLECFACKKNLKDILSSIDFAEQKFSWPEKTVPTQHEPTPILIQAPDTLDISGFVIPVPENIKHMYETFIRDTKTGRNPVPVDQFMMAHTPKTYKALVSSVISELISQNAQTIINNWNFVDDYPIARAIEAIGDIAVSDNPDVPLLLKTAIFHLNSRLKQIEKDLNKPVDFNKSAFQQDPINDN